MPSVYSPNRSVADRIEAKLHEMYRPLQSVSVVWVQSSRTVAKEIPLIVLEGGRFDLCFYRYLHLPRNIGKSTVWMRVAARAVALLIDHRAEAAPPRGYDHADFRRYLVEGVLSDASPNYVARLVAIAEEYESYSLSGDVPRRVSTQQARDAGLLRHLSGPAKPGPRRSSHHAGRPRPIPFPHAQLPSFFQALVDGSATPSHAIRDQLLFLLLAFGGIRSSEVLHLWVSDVATQHGRAEIFFYHPAYGPVDSGPRPRVSRQSELATSYGLLPRHLLGAGSSKRVGWKGMMFDEPRPGGSRTRVYWLDQRAAELFTALHLKYVTHIRPRLGRHHPYYFVSLSGPGPGEPATLGSLRDTFARAAHAAGLSGYGPHSMRHAYAQRLTDLGLSVATIQAALHHQSPASQAVYTRPGPEQVNEQLAEAIRGDGLRRRVDGGGVGWRSDHLNLFPGVDSTWRRIR